MQLAGAESREDGGSSHYFLMFARNVSTRTVVATVALIATVATIGVAASTAPPSSHDWEAALFFTAFGLLASGLGYKTSNATTGSIGFLPFLSIAAIAPNIAAIGTVVISIAGAELLARRQAQKAIFNLAQFVLAEGAAICLYLAVGGKSIGSWPEEPLNVPAFIAMVGVWLVLNKLAVSVVVSVATGAEVRQHWLKSMKVSAVYDLFSFPLIFFFAIAYVRFGAGMSSALALPMLGMRQLYKNNIVLQKINEELLELMVGTVDAQDPYTSGHSQRVSMYARTIAEIAGMKRRDVKRIEQAALLHDIGKIYAEFTPIVRKPGRLTDEEYEIMKSHSEKGARLVARVSHFEDLVPMIVSHHEAWDGRGYPHGLREETIPIGARVIALADTIDAMSTSRPYRDALSLEIVRGELEKQASRQFDPAMCSKLLSPDGWATIVARVAEASEKHPVAVRYGIQGSVERRTGVSAAA
jgi:putative nucleotidyltransferase with HDIG domain